MLLVGGGVWALKLPVMTEVVDVGLREYRRENRDVGGGVRWEYKPGWRLLMHGLKSYRSKNKVGRGGLETVSQV